ncbi:hypothetical protein LCGC14_1508690 [marine sediment metagenome]|uniref:Uncharacterized protein n=1 Tax=marine sediment metagenome TaxID=412755 RepID=A0A0F9J235_9ZZZZ
MKLHNYLYFKIYNNIIMVLSKTSKKKGSKSKKRGLIKKDPLDNFLSDIYGKLFR